MSFIRWSDEDMKASWSHCRRPLLSLLLALCAVCLACADSTSPGSDTSGPTSPTPPGTASVAACKLPARFNGVALGFPRIAGRLKAVGDVRIAMVFTDFSDAPATRTPQEVFGLISPSAENYIRSVSYGRMNVIFEPSYVWRRMSKTSNMYGWSALTYELHRSYIQEALNLAVSSSVNFIPADGISIISNPDAGALMNGPALTADFRNGVVANGKTFSNVTTSGRDLLGWGGGYWFAHETGHNLGLPDLYAFSGAGHRFVGGFSLMGLISGHAREFFGWERWQLGWLDDAQVTCTATGTSEVVLSPIERTGGMKMIVVPTGTTSAVVVESRRAEGFDTNGTWTPGVVVYFVDTSIGSGQGVLRVIPINDTDNSKSTAALTAGASVNHSGVTVTFVSQDTDGDRVRVSR